MSRVFAELSPTRETITRPFVESFRGALAGEPQRLRRGQEREVLAFLAARPIHTVYMAGLTRDNGLENEANRGTFYGCRDRQGHLEGVAIVGHHLLFEARTRSALKNLALLARRYRRATHMILGEQRSTAEFWHHYSAGTLKPRSVRRELLFELRRQRFVGEAAAASVPAVPELRPATRELVELVAPLHAQLAFEVSGVNPLDRDPIGFVRRCLRRIERGRVWTLKRDGRLLFKADVVSETHEVVYLEGVYVAPEERGHGLGTACLRQMTNELLGRTKTICLLADEENHAAHALYRRTGFRLRSRYESIFLGEK
jgi:ribosomal protein S18 acetylase RimI-like enzyme